jgi:hypothetical protein
LGRVTIGRHDQEEIKIILGWFGHHETLSEDELLEYARRFCCGQRYAAFLRANVTAQVYKEGIVDRQTDTAN